MRYLLFSPSIRKRIKFHSQSLFLLFIPFPFRKPIPMPAMTGVEIARALQRRALAITERESFF